jgi:nucleobase:cation symporter-1, NCS1 family
MSSAPKQEVAPLEEALEGRLPVLPSERIYNRYGALLWTTAVLSAASYAYLVGGALASFGNTRLSIAGYLVGLIVGEVVVVTCAGVPSYRSGVDTIDAAKSALGTRGSVLVLLSVLATCLGWAYVLVAMSAEGASSLVQLVHGSGSRREEALVVVVALFLLAVVWLLAIRGPAAMAKLSSICAPAQIALALGLMGVLLYRYGATSLWQESGASAAGSPRMLPIAYGIELGFANALSLLPYIGGLTRLVRHRRHLVGPTVVGSGIVGAWVIATVAALATVATGLTDPAAWILRLVGPVAGAVIVTFLIVANIGTLVVQVYVAGVAAQQVRWIAGLPWKWVLALAIAPGALFAFKTQWLLAHVATWLGYNGVIFVGMAAVLLADYYWYVAGVNWAAMAIIAGSSFVYMMVFDPITFAVRPIFRYAGAGIPVVLVSAILYWAMMSAIQWIAVRPSKYSEVRATNSLEVGL